MRATRANSTHQPGGPLPPRGTGHAAPRPLRRIRLGGAWLVVSALLPVLGCYFMFAVLLPTDVRRYEEYVAAEPCPAHTAARQFEDCLREVAFTVDATEVHGGRNSRYTATLSGAPAGNGVLPFGDSGPLLELLRPGDRVTGTVWRGNVMAVAKDGVRQESSDEPRDEPQMTAAIGTFMGLLAAQLLGTGVLRLARPRSHETYGWRPYGRPLLIAMVITCLALGFPALLLGYPWWIVPPLAVAVVACTAWLLYRHRRPGPAQAV
ncbi:hypothetical protein [Streptomyces sp. NPDC059788]|uniref:hypothetical protein n=1 Tax=Streptomyces sp. NPDC059788 TaxID=3346948 RepID=UPI003658BD24